MLKIIALCLLLVFFKASIAIHPACLEPHEPGPCRGYISSFFYDPQSNTCKRFYYGGCGGTRNRFYSKEACMDVCSGHSSSWILKPRKGNFFPIPKGSVKVFDA
ncbi:Amyloid-beta A4 protein [Taenia solium]|eukprot:TsM_001022000 transcript=TsM_001022000 gene=TsM_001022000